MKTPNSVLTDYKAEIILASGSPRRVDLLDKLGLVFSVVPSNIDENNVTGKTPCETVIELARRKAHHVYDSLETKSKESQLDAPASRIVLGADTSVVLDNEMIGKPRDIADAREILGRLSGRRHEVYTGVSILLKEPTSDKLCELTSFELSHVYFRKLVPGEIEAYIETEEPFDKAGAYALQGIGAAFVQQIEGCFTNVIGLPIPLVVSMLRRAGLRVLGETGRRSDTVRLFERSRS